MKRNLTECPPVTQRIMEIIMKEFNGRVRSFCTYMGLKDSAKINRLFKRDTRSGKYPMPSSDVILMISEKMNVSADWLLKGIEEKPQSVNNININTNKGNGNTITENSTVQSTAELAEIIKKQQEQIDLLLKTIIGKNGQ